MAGQNAVMVAGPLLVGEWRGVWGSGGGESGAALTAAFLRCHAAAAAAAC